MIRSPRRKRLRPDCFRARSRQLGSVELLSCCIENLLARDLTGHVSLFQLAALEGQFGSS